MGRSITLCLAALFCWAAAARAQAPEPGGLAVEKYSWAKERVGWESDPFAGPVENFDDTRRRRVDERRVERARGAGNIGEANKVEREMRAEQVIKARPTAPPRYTFHYKIAVRNTGAKAVKEVDWDYVFLDAATGNKLWEFTTGGPITGSPALAAGRVVVTSQDGTVYVFG